MEDARGVGIIGAPDATCINFFVMRPGRGSDLKLNGVDTACRARSRYVVPAFRVIHIRAWNQVISVTDKALMRGVPFFRRHFVSFR